MNHPLVVNHARQQYDVFVGRGSAWGNPFVLGRDGDRATVIAKHRDWLPTQPRLMARLSELRGKRLG